ncbi:MAG: rhomboid family intramembrane serine protease [Bacteroidota bacterium]
MTTEINRYLRQQWQRPGNGLMQIIIVNGIIFVATLLLHVVLVVVGYDAYFDQLLQRLAVPASWEALGQQPWSLLTHCWVHIRFFPLFWNLLMLQLFGQIVMDLLGSRHCWALYWLGGLVGSGFFLLLYNLSPHFRGTHAFLLGMQGSLYAIMAAAGTLAPRFSLHLLFIGPVQLRYLVGFALLVACYSLVDDAPAMGIAHLGGALFGYTYVKQVMHIGPWLQQVFWRFVPPWRRSRHRLRIIKPQSKGPVSATPAGAKDDDTLIDTILDKVAANGYDSLTLAEKQQLFRASK